MWHYVDRAVPIFSGAAEWSGEAVARLDSGWAARFRRRERVKAWVAFWVLIGLCTVQAGLAALAAHFILRAESIATYPHPDAEVRKADHWGWYCREYPKTLACTATKRALGLAREGLRRLHP